MSDPRSLSLATVQEVVLAGFGGQGVQLAGRLLATAAMRLGLNVLVHNYYEGFVRGGVSECTVALCMGEIDSPVRPNPTVVAALDDRALESWQTRVRPNGLLVRNHPGVSGAVGRSDLRVIDIPASELAAAVGNPMTVSMVVVGALAPLTGWFTLETCKLALEEVVPAHRRNLIAVNAAALERGASFVTPAVEAELHGAL